MSYFKQLPINTVDTDTVPILNEDNQLLSDHDHVNKYDIKSTMLDTITLHKCITADWLENLKNSLAKSPEVQSNLLFISNKLVE